ncbi:MAG: bifunctional 4-hydroxy-2-oxoglutarate aldolase/2-dehydro-3-deoxy-phosphogluconate aldolase [Spirochaetales bacterium]|nr:bifunctional 4-hydroxy-2-oxoglutarate aldolase/2-dehydro-3-deoxy-phosphogluconate aldolase [Spirochaetales bacterium]
MNKEYYSIAKKIEDLAIIPVIALDNHKDAEPLAEALINGGLLAAEITFRTAAAQKSIEIISKKYPQIVTGAGTVLTIDQVKQAMDAGSKFLVSPGFNPTVVDYCVLNNIPIYPGVNNPTGIEMALERGLDILKFFPAEASGGVKMVEAMGAPYGKVKFMATGGISISNVTQYLDSKYIIACGGSWMVKQDMINNGEFLKIEQLCREAVELITEWRK